ncbi:flavonol synthase/flavanone 3-hydroxylase-like [Humulus lupulus]|uniref:flavonol synthase/flavanone 3-hydroxylase-like n=1 Tax=Humulus lupulus TaxID=3486 RepID=UPI002B401A30|nr:flavonol synthase/flavanone 3-hydroxylase-like [Humulus lupulus]XP_062078669.1 flavonol synthase/flavanone 3-hydroxylase-like [Humulus lupulus]
MEVERVQALSSLGLMELPEKFIRPVNERPESSKAVEGVTVPVVSLSQPQEVVVKEVSVAAAEWGFFLITDHGIPAALIQRLKEVGEMFFMLPQQEKESNANDPTVGKFEGYGTKMTKNHEEKLEWIDYFFHVMHPLSKVHHEFWPQNPPSYREVTEEYNKEMLRITDVVLQLLSEGLGLEEGKGLKSSLGEEEIELEMKINMYPPCPQPELALGVEAHTDMSAITILVPNEVAGLQVSKDNQWVAVDYLPNALFIHIGDQIEVLSNGKYKSVLHRSLVNKEKTRMSWAVFCVPPHETMIGPIPKLVGDHNLPKFSTKTYAEYRHRKFNKLPQ